MNSLPLNEQFLAKVLFEYILVEENLVGCKLIDRPIWYYYMLFQQQFMEKLP